MASCGAAMPCHGHGLGRCDFLTRTRRKRMGRKDLGETKKIARNTQLGAPSLGGV